MILHFTNKRLLGKGLNGPVRGNHLIWDEEIAPRLPVGVGGGLLAEETVRFRLGDDVGGLIRSSSSFLVLEGCCNRAPNGGAQTKLDADQQWSTLLRLVLPRSQTGGRVICHIITESLPRNSP